MKKSEEKIILITGASRGLGAALAKSFAKRAQETKSHIHLILVAKRMQGLEEIATELDDFGVGLTLVPIDLSKPDNLMTLPNAVQSKFGKLDVLIGNAGFLNALMPLTHYSPKLMEKTINVNMLANWHLLAGLESLMMASDHPRAIFVTSGAANMNMPFWGPYAASKAALDVMIKTYAEEKKQTNYRINLVDPGIMNTDMFKTVMPGADMSQIPKPVEKVNVFHYLSSPQCQETGQLFKASEFNESHSE